MFENIEKNRIMIDGAYKKIKSFFYYDKTMLYNKMQLATWEQNMEHNKDELANFMLTLEKNTDTDYLSMLVKKISFIPMPKAFNIDSSQTNVLQNSVSTQNELSKVNFFLKAPVELLILDAIWALMIGKIAFDEDCFSNDMYANRLKAHHIFNKDNDLFHGIDFKSNRLFYPYFRQYSLWRNNALSNVSERYKMNKDSILITLDIKSYYYSVVFEFDHLRFLLNDDKRLKEIECLTNIIQSIYISYTAEIQKYFNNIPANCKRGQSALPIGLISSMILSNLYLKDFDNTIRQNIQPSYYGRYVDDIILIIDKSDNMSISKDYILEKTFVITGIFESIDESYRIISQEKNLILQKNKIKCICFNHEESDTMLKLLCEASDMKPSMSDGFLLPDIDLSNRDFDSSAHTISIGNGTLKVRDFEISTNNYTASLFLNDLIRASKNVDVKEEKHSKYIEKQIKQILRFYNSQRAVDFRSAWTSVFNLMLINEKYDSFISFYEQVYKAISLISSNNIEGVYNSKLNYILEQIKTALWEQLSISASIALAPHSISSISEAMNSHEFDCNSIFKINSEFVFSNAKDIRYANLYNNHIITYPLLNYMELLNDDISLVNTNLKNICQLERKTLDIHKLKYSPRFIHLDELYLWQFLVSFPNGGNPFLNNVSRIYRQFTEINNIDLTLVNIRETVEHINENDRFQHICINDGEKNDTIKAALASIYIDEEKDVIPVLDNANHNLTTDRKSRLYKLLNDAKNKRARIIVFPEFFMPIQWIQEILIFSRKNHIAILSGLRYLVDNNKAYNYITILQPFSFSTFKYSIPLFREKNYYAPEEKVGLAQKKLICNDPANKSTHLISWNNLNYSDLMCYELTNIEYRFNLRGRIELLIVPELNKDTNYFSNMVDATTRDLHSFVIQVNTSKYGDSRITAPYSSYYKDIIKLKGGKDDILLTGVIEISDLINNRDTCIMKLNEKIDQARISNDEEKKSNQQIRKIKDPVAGFQKGGASK